MRLVVGTVLLAVLTVDLYLREAIVILRRIQRWVQAESVLWRAAITGIVIEDVIEVIDVGVHHEGQRVDERRPLWRWHISNLKLTIHDILF